MIVPIRALRSRWKSKGHVDVESLRGLLNADLLNELVTREDLQNFKEFITTSETQNKYVANVNKGVVAHVDRAYANLLPRDQYRTKKDELREDLKVPWVADVTVNDDAREVIRKLGPPKPLHISVNNRDGNFVVIRSRVYVRAYSWTLHRRPGMALKMALRKAWTCWEQETGHDAPSRFLNEIEQIDENAMFAVAPDLDEE